MCKKLTALVLVFSFLFTMTSCNQPLPTSDIPLIKAVKENDDKYFNVDLEGFKEKFNSVSEIPIIDFISYKERFKSKTNDSIIAIFEDKEYTDLLVYANEQGYVTDIKLRLTKQERFDTLLRGCMACFDFGEEKEPMKRAYEVISDARSNFKSKSDIINHISVYCSSIKDKYSRSGDVVDIWIDVSDF